MQVGCLSGRRRGSRQTQPSLRPTAPTGPGEGVPSRMPASDIRAVSEEDRQGPRGQGYDLLLPT